MSAEGSADTPRLEVWRQNKSAWSWRYVTLLETGEVLELPANEPESSREEAVHAARLAYPGVTLEVLDEAAAPGPTARAERRRTRKEWILGLVLLAAVCGAWLRTRRNEVTSGATVRADGAP